MEMESEAWDNVILPFSSMNKLEDRRWAGWFVFSCENGGCGLGYGCGCGCGY